ncbi:VWA domain-containing protein [uncultured Alistipes sp.]|uniref:VWA domain-containing protein n=1 Tax=uncultured Alistipes sp. TaxID=538949 RepID=UPI0032091D53
MYTQSITRTHRTAFILLIDGSGSMNEEILFHGKRMTKAEAVASITNGMLFELVERARRSDGVRDYYDISVLTYSGDNEVYSLLPEGREMLSVAELAAGEIPMKRELVEYRMPDGSTSLRELPVPDWIAAEAAGQTPMYQALDHAYEIAEAWCRNPAHAESFPPTVFNITDGEATDCDEEELRTICERIRSLRTCDGHVLLINIHIAPDESQHAVFFPTEEEAAYSNRYAGVLYDCSSPMPEVFNEAIREAKGPGALPPFRGMSYNTSAEQLIAMLNIGSISVKTE